VPSSAKFPHEKDEQSNLVTVSLGNADSDGSFDGTFEGENDSEAVFDGTRDGFSVGASEGPTLPLGETEGFIEGV
jgi:hypothetical protein